MHVQRFCCGRRSLQMPLSYVLQCTMLRPLTRNTPKLMLRPRGQQPYYRSLATLSRLPQGPRKINYLAGGYSSIVQRPDLRVEWHRNLLYNGSSSTSGISMGFHSTPRNQGGPLIPLFAAMLKTSTAFELARTASRIALTLFPILLIKNHKSRHKLKHAAIHGVPTSEEKTTNTLNRIRKNTLFLHFIFLVPFTLFWATIIASLERTPLTGRWRMIILSPEEEDEIANQLAGQGWYDAVGKILAEDGPPRIISPTDWRYKWVDDTMRRLETTIPILAREPEMCPEWLDGGEDGKPLPPPAEYPLRPRPRASEYLRWFCESLCERKIQPVPHHIPGPPYSLLVVDKPDSSNAFSYGFGPDGGGGIVVYSGFLDDIFAKMPPEYNTPPPVERSWWSRLFYSSPSRPLHPTPTTEQTTELAILLAHELSHLVLSHHLETLSSGSVIIPGTLSIASDVIRVLIFPITMLFGPFVNDAVAQLGKVGSGELVRVGEYCTSMKQEVEADVVSARLLAHAGFDARDAVKFWETRHSSAVECSASRQEQLESQSANTSSLARRIMGSAHPVSEVRVESLREELARWESERQVAAARARTNSASHTGSP